MKIPGVLAAAAVAATVIAVAPTAASEDLRLHVNGVSGEPVRFVVEGSGGGGATVESSASIVNRTENGRSIIEVTTPATIRLVTSDTFTIRFRALDDGAAVAVTVSGSTGPDAHRTVIEGHDVEFARRQAGGPVQLLRSARVWVGPHGNR